MEVILIIAYLCFLVKIKFRKSSALINITVLTINQAVSYCDVNLDCMQSMQCEFVSIERQGNVLSFRTLFFLGKPCGYMAFMMNNARENRLCNRKIRWRHWKSTSRKCFLFYTYLKSYNNVHGYSISNQHCTCIALILVTQAIQTG